MRDNPHAEPLRRRGQCSSERGVGHQDNRAFHTFLIFRHVEVQPVFQPAHHRAHCLCDHRRDRVVRSPVADREIVHVLRQPQSRPLAHQAVTGPDEQHVEDGAGEDRICDDGCVGRDRLRHRPKQSHTPLKAEDQENVPEQRSWEPPVASPSPHVPEPDLLKALRHVQQRRAPAHAWSVVVPFLQHQVSPCCHFGRTAFARPVIGPGLRNDPLIQNGLAHPFPHSYDGWHESDGSLSCRCLGNQEVDQVSESAQAKSVCVQHRSTARCTIVYPF